MGKKTLKFHIIWTSYFLTSNQHRSVNDIDLRGTRKKKSDWYLCWTSLQSQGNYCKI